MQSLYSTWDLELVIGRNLDWFHERNNGTLSKKHQLFTPEWLHVKSKESSFANAKQKVQRKLGLMKYAWYGKKANEIHSYADLHPLQQALYDALKTV